MKEATQMITLNHLKTNGTAKIPNLTEQLIIIITFPMETTSVSFKILGKEDIQMERDQMDLSQTP